MIYSSINFHRLWLLCSIYSHHHHHYYHDSDSFSHSFSSHFHCLIGKYTSNNRLIIMIHQLFFLILFIRFVIRFHFIALSKISLNSTLQSRFHFDNRFAVDVTILTKKISDNRTFSIKLTSDGYDLTVNL